jgi:hypothetical protein
VERHKRASATACRLDYGVTGRVPQRECGPRVQTRLDPVAAPHYEENVFLQSALGAKLRQPMPKSPNQPAGVKPFPSDRMMGTSTFVSPMDVHRRTLADGQGRHDSCTSILVAETRGTATRDGPYVYRRTGTVSAHPGSAYKAVLKR